MKKFCFTLMLLMLAGFAAAQDAPTITGTGHPFACGDYTGGKAFIVAADGKVEWEYSDPGVIKGGPNDLWVLPGGNLLINTGHGVREVTRDKKVVFDYQSKSEIYACQRLANGNTFIGECTGGRLIEVDPQGKIVKELNILPEGKKAGHPYIRNARKLENGNYLVTHYGEQVVKEYDPQGKIVREIAAPGGPHSVARLKNGNTLITCGDMTKCAQVIEVDPAGKVVWSVKDGDLPGIALKFIAGFQRLPNGNTVICNWLGHNQFGAGPQLIEVTPEKKVVWTFANEKVMRTISSVQLLDIPGDAIKGELMH